jgi:hypothetical protein
MPQLLQFLTVYTGDVLHKYVSLIRFHADICQACDDCTRYQRHLAIYVAVEQMLSVAVPMLSKCAIDGEKA